MKEKLLKLIREYQQKEGCSDRAMVRDAVVDLIHIADELNIPHLDDIFGGAVEVYMDEKEE